MNPRVSILCKGPSSHQMAVFRGLASKLDLQVLLTTESTTANSDPGEADIETGFSSGLRKSSEGIVNRKSFVARTHAVNALAKIRRFQPHIVVTEELGVLTLEAQLYCRLTEAELIIWTASTDFTEGWVSSRRRNFNRHYARLASRLWTNGHSSSALMRTYGIADDRIDAGIIAVDTSAFLTLVDDFRSDRDRIRSANEWNGTVFCFDGEVSLQNGIHEYLEAIRCACAVLPKPASFLFIGDGKGQVDLKEWSRSNRIKLDLVIAPDERRRAQLYSAADVFVFPTLRDKWAIQCVEAACAGMVQVFSKFNGATPDLLAAGAAGIVVNPYDISSLSSALENYTLEGPAMLGHATRQLVSTLFSPEECISRICASVERCLKLPRGTVSGRLPMVVPEEAEYLSRTAAG
jgi:glycosyltransferase involved in cell wall biosynthesis